MPEHATVNLDDIRIDGGTQQRPLSQEALDAYEERRRGGEEFPPLQTVFDGMHHWLWDGFHRYHVARKVSDTTVAVEATEGTQRDAVWLSFSANKSHGVPRPRGCATEIIRKILADPEWRKVPQAEIARHVGVSAMLVSKVRASINRFIDAPASPAPAGADRDPARTVTRRGRKYAMKVGRIGRPRSKKPAVSPHALKPVRGYSAPMPMTAMNVPHDPAAAARGLVALFDRPFLESLVTELTNLLKGGSQ
jgi:hypothetical protein